MELFDTADYTKMTTEELSALFDDDLFEAVVERTEQKVNGFERWSDGVNSLNPAQRLFYSVYWLDAEVNNGGLCQFLTNSSRVFAPVVSRYMEKIGATDHQKLYDGFLSENNIDPNDLSSFDISTVEDYVNQYQRYPFDEYDNAFGNLEPLETYLVAFIREHINDF